MNQYRKRETLVASLVLTLSLSAVPRPAALFKVDPVLAQSVVPNASSENSPVVKIGSSSSMAVTNQNFTQRLKQQSPNAEVKVDYQEPNTAIQSLQDGKVDLAAVGRSLTAQEKANLVVVPQDRKKIAIVVGANNPFTGDLTFEQFAKIFRGEITDWSEVGGEPGQIQLVDRPDANDTRQALQTYDVFKQAPFQAAAGATKLAQDDTDPMVKALGNRGISYAIADQVTDKPGVRIVPMHKTLPSDPRYPFSQPLAYVYKGTPSPAVQAFLGNAVPASPVAVPASPAVTAPVPAQAPAAVQTTDRSGLPWWLLLLPLLGAGLWWLLRNRSRRAIAPVVTPKVVPVPPPAPPIAPAAVSPPLEPALPVVPAADSSTFKLYEERLVADTVRQKVADVSISKHIETEQAQVSIPLETERVVIEHIVPSANIVAPDATFAEGEVARIETYKETPDIHKETFIREEVSVRKEIEHDIVDAEATVRKEQLDIDTGSDPTIHNHRSHR